MSKRWYTGKGLVIVDDAQYSLLCLSEVVSPDDAFIFFVPPRNDAENTLFSTSYIFKYSNIVSDIEKRDKCESHVGKVLRLFFMKCSLAN